MTRPVLRTALAAGALVLLAGAGVPAAARAAVPAPASVPAPALAVRHGESGLDAWWYDAMKLAKAHRQSTGKGVKIAVIDEAIDPTVQELAGADVRLGTSCNGQRVRPAKGEKADHGTNVTALIVGTGRGTGPGGKGIRGVAPDAQVTFYATDNDPRDANVDCTQLVDTSEIVKAAIDGKPDIITTSLGLGYDYTMRDELARAEKAGIVVVGATGDRTRPSSPDFPMEFPAGRPGVVAVNAADRHGRPWANNPGPVHSFVDGNPVISGPGVDVTGLGFQAGRGWVSGVSRTGTSDAAPLVAGALALVKAKYPDATGHQLIQQLVHYPSSRRYGWSAQLGFGLVSVTAMLAHDPTRWPDENPLLKGPERALRDFPMSAYGAASTSASVSADPTAPSASPAAQGGDTHQDSEPGTTPAANDDTGGGVPVWVWPVAAVVVAGAAGAGVAARRRGSRPVPSGRYGEEG